MTKREITRFTNKIKKLETKLGKKRDEIRVILSDLEGLVEDFSQADDSMDAVVRTLRLAREELEGATDTMSQLV